MKNIVLTPKQQRFCDEYLKDLNATKAALRAGYSAGTALNGNLMGIPKIRYYLQEHTKRVRRKVHVDHEMIVRELCKIAFGNMGNYFNDDGSMKGMHELTDDEKAGIWSMTLGDGDKVSARIRMYSKMAALEKLAKHTGFYNVEAELPEKEYVYIDKDNADTYDTFDDELFANEDNEDDDEFSDDYDDIYYPWDSECKLAVAQARAACKTRYYAAKDEAKRQKLKAEIAAAGLELVDIESGENAGGVAVEDCVDKCTGYEFSMSEEEEDEYERLAAAQRKRFEGKTPRELAEMMAEGQARFEAENKELFEAP